MGRAGPDAHGTGDEGRAGVAAAGGYCGGWAAGPSESQTLGAIGRYEKGNHSTRKIMTAENFMRAARPPVISATVIAAKVSWNMQ